MGDTRPIGALPPFGQVGSLLYLPRERCDGGIGVLETGRKLIHAPEFGVLRPFEVVNPAPKSSDVEDVDDVTYDERRVQERWLNNTLPEAYLGNTALPNLLGSVTARAPGRPHFKVHAVAGEISDCRDPWRVTGVASLAMATGEGGQILRILRLCESPWFWGEDEHASLGVWDLRPGDREEEAYWCRDAAPITRIKYFTHLALGAPLRWLVVQKGSSTTILSPVYHSVPVSYSNAALEERSASRVDPNEMLSLTLAHTAGRSHVDVDFNPPRSGAPLQVSIIDDHGGWSIWNVNGDLSPAAHTSPRLSLYKRGTFWAHIPDEQRGGFGILWYHPQSDSSASAQEPPDGGNEEPGSNTAALPNNASGLIDRSHTLVIWNHSTIQVLDTRVGSITSYLQITERSEYKEMILQIQPNPSDPSQAFVLTTHSLLCLDICPSAKYSRKGEPRILHAFLHDHPGDPTLQFSALSSTLSGKPACVVVFPNSGPRANVFWFYGATGGASVGQFFHQLQYLRRDNRPELDSLHTLCILPLRLAGRHGGAPSSGQGPMFSRHGVEFQQVVSIGRRQSMGYWVCATAKRGMGKITAPQPWNGAGLGPERNPQTKNQVMRRLAYTRYMAEKFVVPDSLEDVDAFVQPRRGDGTPHEHAWLEFEPLPSVKREVVVKRRFYPHVVMEAYRASLLNDSAALRSGALEVVRQMLEAGLKPDNNHRVSLLECVDVNSGQHVNAGDRDGNPPLHANDDEDWAWQLDDIVKGGLGAISLTEVHPNPPWHTSAFGEKLVAMKDWLAEIWPIPSGDSQPEAAAQRRAVLEETALLAVLAYHTIEAKDPLLSSQDTLGLFSSQASTLAFSSQTTMDFRSQPPLSSQQLPSSQPSSSQPTASQQQARREADQEASRAAIARLSALATNLRHDASLSTAPQHPVLGRWDEATSENYMTFIERPAAALQERLRRRREKNVERRKAKEEAFNRLTGRAEVASSPGEGGSGWLGAGPGGLRGAVAAGQLSQGTSIPLRVRAGEEPMSSQGTSLGMSQGITMSQPVGGVFGQRMGKKKKKKKGGIR